MSQSFAITCDRCGNDEHCEDQAEADAIGWYVEGYSDDEGIEDPNDDLCPQCFTEAQEAYSPTWEPEIAGHPNPARALPAPTGAQWCVGTRAFEGRPAYTGEVCPACGLIHGKETT